MRVLDGAYGDSVPDIRHRHRRSGCRQKNGTKDSRVLQRILTSCLAEPPHSAWLEIAQHAILSNAKRTPTVDEVIQEHIDLLIRPSSGTTKTYQTMLDRQTAAPSGMRPRR
jgi:hypothetical protein